MEILKSDTILLSILFGTIASGAIIITFLLINLIRKTIDRSSKTYNEALNMVMLNKQREYYENLVYKLQNELSSNQKRLEEINHLVFNAQSSFSNNNITDFSNISFFKNLGINKTDFEKQNITNDVFVLTPFLDKETNTFAVIKNLCQNINLKCIRGDEEFRENDILSHIVKSIITSRIIIANLNGRNPNVFYELGICHAIGKPVILVSKNLTNMPFDLQSKNIILYDNEDDLQNKLKDTLLKYFSSNNI